MLFAHLSFCRFSVFSFYFVSFRHFMSLSICALLDHVASHCVCDAIAELNWIWFTSLCAWAVCHLSVICKTNVNRTQLGAPFFDKKEKRKNTKTRRNGKREKYTYRFDCECTNRKVNDNVAAMKRYTHILQFNLFDFAFDRLVVSLCVLLFLVSSRIFYFPFYCDLFYSLFSISYLSVCTSFFLLFFLMLSC